MMNAERAVAARVFRTLSMAEIRVMDAWLATGARKTFPQKRRVRLADLDLLPVTVD